ncbi:hypothetical protein BC941DRAFT_511546 [Chlamydoabsidia padenii]|nr:hypothetical protein BC941DRAFT_511546 [Chlamydoabsidia padenii]
MDNNKTNAIPNSGDDSRQVDHFDKKVAQNRAAQKAFRIKRQNYIEELENKAKQLEEWKRTVIQLQAENDCLRNKVTGLEDQLKVFIKHDVSPPSPPLSSPPSSPPVAPIKRKPTLSKREKKKQRLLADAKLYKNDDLEPIQLHCPLAYNPPFSNPSIAPSFMADEVLPLLFEPGLESPQDQFINFVGDLDPCF